MCAYMHTYLYVYMHMYIYRCMYIYIHIYMYTYIHAYTYTRMYKLKIYMTRVCNTVEQATRTCRTGGVCGESAVSEHSMRRPTLNPPRAAVWSVSFLLQSLSFFVCVCGSLSCECAHTCECGHLHLSQRAIFHLTSSHLTIHLSYILVHPFSLTRTHSPARAHTHTQTHTHKHTNTLTHGAATASRGP